MNNGWEQLICNYFYMVSLKVLGPYFSELGFMVQKTAINGAVFMRNDLFVEVSYIPETAPTYVPSLIIGVGTSKYDGRGNATGVPAWRILPNDESKKSYSFWKFADENELEFALNKLKSEVIDEYVKPLWEDRAKLERAINDFNRLEADRR